MDVEVLKNEKKAILERANVEKRELTPEEKDRCHVIDKQVYDIENGFFNPSGFIKTSVKVNINAAKDNVPIPHVELKQEKHDVYVPPVGAKEVMEYDKIHNVNVENKPDVTVSEPAPVAEPMPPVAPLENQNLQTVAQKETLVTPSPMVNVENNQVEQKEVKPIVNTENNQVEQKEVSVTIDPTPEIDNNIPKKSFWKKNKIKIILGVILILLILFKLNSYISYEYSSNSMIGTTQGIYVYKFKHKSLNSISGIYFYEAKQDMIKAVKEVYEGKDNTIVVSMSKTKILIITKMKSTDDDWYYSENSKQKVKDTCKNLNNTDNNVCIMF